MADLSNEELQQIAKAFKEMNIKPKADSTEDFKKWMSDFVSTMKDSEIKDEPGTEGTVTTKSGNYIPKISCFSGDGKHDTTYDLWRYEVDCLIKEKYSEGAIAQSIRRSLKGEAGSVAMRMGPDATIFQILDKMESIFGTVERGETIMERFYSARQEHNETTMSWSCRLEEIYRKAVIKGVAKQEEANEKLRSKYWNGLHQWIKDITGYKFDSILEFDELRKEIRLVEKEHDHIKKTHSKMAVTSTNTERDDDIKELKAMVQQLTTKVQELENPNRKNKTNPNQTYRETQDKQRRDSDRMNWGPKHNSSNQYYQNRHQEPCETEDGIPICFKCHQPGHIARNCRVRMDHRKYNLNYSRPAPRGRR